MGPLVYYCRWRGAKLRLRGRDAQTIWGELAAPDVESQPFQFDLQTWELTLGEGANRQRLQLDELGVVVSPDPPMTSVDAGP